MPMSRFKPITTRFPASYFHHLPNAEPSESKCGRGLLPGRASFDEFAAEADSAVIES